MWITYLLNVSRLVCLFVLDIRCDVMLVCVVRDHYVMFSLLILAQYMTAGQTGFRSFETSSMSSLVGVLTCIHLDCVVVCNVALVSDLNLFTWNSLLPYGMTILSIWWFVRDWFPLKVDYSLLYVHMCIYVYMCAYEAFQTIVCKSGQLVLISKRVPFCVRMFVWETAFWQLRVIEAAASRSVRFSVRPTRSTNTRLHMVLSILCNLSLLVLAAEDLAMVETFVLMMTSEILAHHSLLCCLIAILRLVDIWTLCQNGEFQVKCDQISSCVD